VANLTVFLQRLTRGLAAKTLGGLPDGELLGRFAALHEETAFEAIVRRHGPMVLRVCWRVLRQNPRAQFQDIQGQLRSVCDGYPVVELF
jgi:hypothetical protein